MIENPGLYNKIPTQNDLITSNIFESVKNANFNAADIEKLIKELQALIPEENIASLDVEKIEKTEIVGDSIEAKKERVIAVLEKYADRIIGFSLMTNTNGRKNGFQYTNCEELNRYVNYNDRFKDDYELVALKDGVPPDDLLRYGNKESHYIFHTKGNRITFKVFLGECLADPRPGNFLAITIRFEREDKSDKSELIKEIAELSETVNYHYKERDARYKIANEGLPVLEAFRDIALKYKDNSGWAVGIDDFINEYKDLIAKGETKE